MPRISHAAKLPHPAVNVYNAIVVTIVCVYSYALQLQTNDINNDNCIIQYGLVRQEQTTNTV